MTKKRFTYEYDEYNGNLFDNKMHTFYHIEDSDENIEVFCDRLNWLVDENKQLKQENKKLQGKYDQQLWLYNGLGCEYDWLKEENKQLKKENELLKQDLEHCGNQFTNDGKNVLLGLK